MRVLNQQPKDKNKIYPLHEPKVYGIAKSKDHNAKEYGSKASIAVRQPAISLLALSAMNKVYMTVTPEILTQVAAYHAARQPNNASVTGTIAAKAVSTELRLSYQERHLLPKG